MWSIFFVFIILFCCIILFSRKMSSVRGRKTDHHTYSTQSSMGDTDMQGTLEQNHHHHHMHQVGQDFHHHHGHDCGGGGGFDSGGHDG